ncbi:MAG: DUF2867 domain-containing protein [Pseudomonadota bacterium]
MPVLKCDIPALSGLDRRWIETAFFHDSYRVPLRGVQANVVDIFFGIFGHHPLWMKFALIVRNRVALFCGLDAPSAFEILHPVRKSSYSVGEKIGPWPIFFLTPTELVAGHNDKHLDFRLSVLKIVVNGASASAVISTVCTTHNLFGKLYLLFVIPFHTWGVQRLLSSAIATGRL